MRYFHNNYWLVKSLCPGLHSVRCMLISMSITKCPHVFLLNFTITFVEKYARIILAKKVFSVLNSACHV